MAPERTARRPWSSCTPEPAMHTCGKLARVRDRSAGTG